MSKPALALVLEKKQPLTKDKLPSICKLFSYYEFFFF